MVKVRARVRVSENTLGLSDLRIVLWTRNRGMLPVGRAIPAPQFPTSLDACGVSFLVHQPSGSPILRTVDASVSSSQWSDARVKKRRSYMHSVAGRSLDAHTLYTFCSVRLPWDGGYSSSADVHEIFTRLPSIYCTLSLQTNTALHGFQ